jgi:hypothetical protein
MIRAAGQEPEEAQPVTLPVTQQWTGPVVPSTILRRQAGRLRLTIPEELLASIKPIVHRELHSKGGSSDPPFFIGNIGAYNFVNIN